MWNFYDELCTGIPSGIRIEECVVGERWTAVRANGNTGVARTMGDAGCDPAALGRSVVGSYLRDAANFLRWDGPLRASIGVAAMNAFYNTPQKVERGSARPAFADELTGKKAAIIGDLPEVEAGLKDCCALTVLPLPEKQELGMDYDAALTGDFVFISGDALINQSLPALLGRVGAKTKVSLAGVSVPAASVLFAFGNPVHNLSGICVRADSAAQAARLKAKDTCAFSIGPVKLNYLHEEPEVARYAASPYRATGFNSAFNPWKGKDYDRSAWSPIFKG